MPEEPSTAKLSAGPRLISVWAKAPISNDDRTSNNKVSNFIIFSVLQRIPFLRRNRVYRVQCSKSVQLCTPCPYARAARSPSASSVGATSSRAVTSSLQRRPWPPFPRFGRGTLRAGDVVIALALRMILGCWAWSVAHLYAAGQRGLVRLEI